MLRARRFVVQGRVQGVGYRYFVLRQAHLAGVSGFAQNNPDGSVEVWAEGTERALDELETELRRGSTLSRVEYVWTEPAAPRRVRGFEIR